MLQLQEPEDLYTACTEQRSQGRRVGLVPTMGYLHDGHLSLVRCARSRSDFVVLTIFVNPTQFGPGEDLDRYPRDLEGDLARCREASVDCVFTPPAASVYLAGHRTYLDVGGTDERVREWIRALEKK